MIGRKSRGSKLIRRARLLIIIILMIGFFFGVDMIKHAFQDSNNQSMLVSEVTSELAESSMDASSLDASDRDISVRDAPTLTAPTLAASLLNPPTIEGNSAILMDTATGAILMEQDANIAFPVASMSKIMTEYIVQEQIEKGMVHWDDLVEISETANSIDPRGVKIYVAEGDFLTVRDLYSAMVISSANNAAIALAEHISGTEKKFAMLMNTKANELGLSDQTSFVNATGLTKPDGSDNLMTAKDVAQLSYRLLHDFPKALETTHLQQYELAFDGTMLRNSNAMLFPENQDLYYDLVDGLKTGFTESAGYCFTATAKQGDQRLISVVMGANSDQARFLETYKLLSFGFKNL